MSTNNCPILVIAPSNVYRVAGVHTKGVIGVRVRRKGFYSYNIATGYVPSTFFPGALPKTNPKSMCTMWPSESSITLPLCRSLKPSRYDTTEYLKKVEGIKAGATETRQPSHVSRVGVI